MKEHISGQGEVTHDEGIALHSYRVLVSEAEQEMKILFKDKDGKVVGTFTAHASDEAYGLASKILRGYDKMEGI